MLEVSSVNMSITVSNIRWSCLYSVKTNSILTSVRVFLQLSGEKCIENV